jgi:zinc protease
MRQQLRAGVAVGFIMCGAAAVAGAQQGKEFDRSKPPAVPAAKSLLFPKVQQRTLSNGIPIVILEDHARPIVSVSTVIRTSVMLDPDGKTGVGNLVAGLMDEGTTSHTADQLADAFAALGTHVSATGFTTITPNVDRSLELMAELFLHPAFPQASLDRNKANMVAELEQAKDRPGYLANRVLGAKLYGASHPYARQPTPADINAITRDDIVAYYDAYYRPPNLKVVVAGDITPEQAVTKLNRVLGGLTAGKSGDLVPPPVPVPSTTTVYLYDRPGASQSVIVAAEMGPARTTPDYYAIGLMNTVLGGSFNSRINMNLREQHQYTYGASSGFRFRRPPQPSTFMAQSSVVTSKTDSALIELMGEIKGIRTTKPMTAADLSFAKGMSTKRLPLALETIQQRAGAVTGLVSSDQPLDYYNTVVQKYDAVTLSQAERAAKQYVTPDKMVIVVVGDRKAIEPGLRAANIAPMVIVDPL